MAEDRPPSVTFRSILAPIGVTRLIGIAANHVFIYRVDEVDSLLSPKARARTMTDGRRWLQCSCE